MDIVFVANIDRLFGRVCFHSEILKLVLFTCLLFVQVSLHWTESTCRIISHIWRFFSVQPALLSGVCWFLEILRRFWARDGKCHYEWCTGDGNIVWQWGEEKAFSAVGHINIECATKDELLLWVYYVLYFCASEFLFFEGWHKRQYDESAYVVNSGNAVECSVQYPFPVHSLFIEIYGRLFYRVFQIGLWNLVSQLIKGSTCVRVEACDASVLASVHCTGL